MIHGFNDVDKTKVEVIAKDEITNIIYPVGAIYMSVNNVNPATLFGGTWERIVGKFLLSAQTGGSNVGNEGGARSIKYTPKGTISKHKLTVNEMPSHSHNAKMYVGTGTEVWDVVANYGKSNNIQPSVLSTTAEGGGQGHNHNFIGQAENLSTMPPYLVVNVWKRTA